MNEFSYPSAHAAGISLVRRMKAFAGAASAHHVVRLLGLQLPVIIGSVFLALLVQCATLSAGVNYRCLLLELLSNTRI
jgi:hypothetical protein